MYAVVGNEGLMFAGNVVVVGVFGYASATVATHGCGVAVGIVEFHGVVVGLAFLKHDKPVGSDAKIAMAETGNAFGGEMNASVEIVDYDEIVAGSLVFLENHIFFIKNAELRIFGRRRNV